MKQTYQAPTFQLIKLHPESAICAASLPIHDSDTTGPALAPEKEGEDEGSQNFWE